jgi:hypothetical protein
MGSTVSAHALGEHFCHNPDAGGTAPAFGPVEEGCVRGGGECSLASGASALPHDEGFAVDVHKRQGDVFGAALGNNEEGAVVVAIEDHGLFGVWNRAHPERALRPGVIITEVNGATGYWSILEEIQKPGALAMKVSRRPKNAGANWLRDIDEMGTRFRSQGGVNTSSFMLRLQPNDKNSSGPAFSSLPTVRAGDCGVDQCAICIDDVGPEETLAQLPCKHAFHSLCAARWLAESGRAGGGKRQCCPLCCRRVTSAPDSGILETE